MSRYSKQPLDLSAIRTYPLESRPSKVTTDDFARPVRPDASLKEYLDGLPDILAARELKELAGLIRGARQNGRAIITGIGGHVIKTGLGPLVVDLMRRGFITAIAMNGSAMIHDFEIGLVGATSEDVDATLGGGQFGMAEETGRIINEATIRGADDKIGLGEAVGRQLVQLSAQHAQQSVLATAYELRIPVTVHVAIGTDIV